MFLVNFLFVFCFLSDIALTPFVHVAITPSFPLLTTDSRLTVLWQLMFINFQGVNERKYDFEVSPDTNIWTLKNWIWYKVENWETNIRPTFDHSSVLGKYTLVNKL